MYLGVRAHGGREDRMTQVTVEKWTADDERRHEMKDMIYGRRNVGSRRTQRLEGLPVRRAAMRSSLGDEGGPCMTLRILAVKETTMTKLPHWRRWRSSASAGRAMLC